MVDNMIPLKDVGRIIQSIKPLKSQCQSPIGTPEVEISEK